MGSKATNVQKDFIAQKVNGLGYQDKFYLLFEPIVPPKISKIACPSMKICTGTPTLASSKKAMFSSHKIGLQLLKMKRYLTNFIRAYMGDHGKIHSKQRLLSKKVNFVQLETNHIIKNHLFVNWLQV